MGKGRSVFESYVCVCLLRVADAVHIVCAG